MKMESLLRVIVLLFLSITVAKTESNTPVKVQPTTTTEANSGQKSLESIRVKLNITICIPPLGNEDTKFTSTSINEISESQVIFTVQAQKPGKKPPCDPVTHSVNSSCATPELSIRITKETKSGITVICSTDIYDQELRAILNTESQNIIITANRTDASTNTATAIITLLSTNIGITSYSKSSTEVSIIAEVAQTWAPSTSVTSKTETTAHRVLPRTPARILKPTKSVQPSFGESMLCRGPMTGLILLVLVPALLLLY